MGYIDGNFQFGLPAITNSTTRTISTNVLDTDAAASAEAATPAVTLFGSPKIGFLAFRTNITTSAGTPSIRVELIGADNAALTTLPIKIVDTGVIVNNVAGAALSQDASAIAGNLVDIKLAVSGQVVAKRYYGCFITLGGTNPDIVVAANQLYIALTPQTMLPGAQVAVPAT